VTDKKTWMVAQVRDKYYAMDTETYKVYDPHDLSRMTSWFNKQRFTEAEAKRWVDKMNAKGPAVEVSGKKDENGPFEERGPELLDDTAEFYDQPFVPENGEDDGQ